MKTDDEQYRKTDLPFYMSEVAPCLPERILDFHAHTWTAETRSDRGKPAGAGGRYMVSDVDYPPEKLLNDGSRCFPDREYSAVCFGNPTPGTDWKKDTAYVSAAGEHPRLYPLVLAGCDLKLSREDYERALESGNFFGFKVFINWVGNDYGDVEVEDMLGPAEMRLADEKKLIVMLHVPRSGRLADPVVQKGVGSLARDFPNASIVLAHCGRCYLPSEMSAAADCLKELPNVSMDTSMVMDPTTLQIALEAIGPERILFGTDFPVAAMRGRRVRVMDHWVDVVLEGYPESAFRVKSSDIRATFMAIEIAVAVRDAAELTGITPDDLEGIFYENGMTLLERVDDGQALDRKQRRT
jgi:hypothetical protein